MVQFTNENNHIKQNYQTLCKVKNKNAHQKVNDKSNVKHKIKISTIIASCANLKIKMHMKM